MTESDRQRQLAHIDAAIALCDRSATPEEIIAAESLLAIATNERQGQLELRAA